ncbi:hypothetical protein BSKO_02337 [Bryopsis sp. KO-2023]|nr:hypothetical protein BSKO_02337 [Bryopsis sp. KO-2023]
MAGQDYYSPDPLSLSVGLRMQGGWGMGGERFFPCVRLRGLPFTVTAEDIRMFLGGHPVDVLVVKKEGRTTGEAYVVYGSTVEVDMALAKNKGYMGRRYVEVFKAKKLDYYKAIVSEMTEGGPISASIAEPVRPRRGFSGSEPTPQVSGPTTVLRMRGLPFSVIREDIVNWFNDGSLPIPEVKLEDLFLVMDFGRPSGVAFVEFRTAEDAQHALSKDRQMMGTRYIEIFASTPEELKRYTCAQSYR